MNEFPLSCPLVWCERSDDPMGEAEYLQHLRDAHFPDRGGYDIPDGTGSGVTPSIEPDESRRLDVEERLSGVSEA